VDLLPEHYVTKKSHLGYQTTMTIPFGPTLSSLLHHGRTAVVTGASSGIGKSACLAWAACGMHIWMVDVDAAELTAAHASVKAAAAAAVHADQRIEMAVVDVASATAVEDLARTVFAATGHCHVLMNNAGIGLGGDALTDLNIVHQVMNVNTYGPIHGCLAFVPRMQASGEPGIIINTGSKQGITMPPGNLTYNMSKAALKVYTEGLEHQLMKARQAGTGHLRAVLLVPGWVNTSIALKTNRAKASSRGESYDDSLAPFHEDKPHSDAWMPRQVIEFMTQEIDVGRFYILCPDNDVDRATDHARMTWTMQDITQDRPPLSRWHPDYQSQFTDFLERSKALNEK
jgi:NAD(P)-dependent dehydrogenase (short-subunit alcohol dehydrogenase family)